MKPGLHMLEQNLAPISRVKCVLIWTSVGIVTFIVYLIAGTITANPQVKITPYRSHCKDNTIEIAVYYT